MSQPHRKTVPIPAKPQAPEQWVQQGQRLPAPRGRTKRLTLDIPATLHKRLKQRALDEETTILALVTAWCEAKLGD